MTGTPEQVSGLLHEAGETHHQVGRDSEAEAEPPEAAVPRTMRALRGGCGTGQEIAAFTSSATFFSTMGLHFLSAYDTGHTSPSSRFAASWKPRVE